MEGQWRGGLVAYGYRLEYLGRTNKKNQPVRDLVIDEEEAKVVKKIYSLLSDEGYGTNRVANYLNEQGIKTKRGTTLWRGTSIRSLIANPIYKGVLRFGDDLSEPFEHLRIVDDITFDRCLELVKGRACKPESPPEVPVRTDSRSLLTGLLFYGECGSRLCYSHNRTTRKLADGTIRVYDRDLYRCYRKLSSRKTCSGPSGYEMEPLNETVESEVRQFFRNLGKIPTDQLVERACSRNAEMLQVAYRQAVSEFEKTQKQVSALETEAVKALTGENQLDLSVVNSMLMKQKARLDAAAKAKEETKVQLEIERNNKKANEVQVDEMLTWATRFDEASIEAKHLVIAQLVDRIEIRKNTDYEISIHWRMTAEQFLGRTAEASA